MIRNQGFLLGWRSGDRLDAIPRVSIVFPVWEIAFWLASLACFFVGGRWRLDLPKRHLRLRKYHCTKVWGFGWYVCTYVEYSYGVRPEKGRSRTRMHV